MKRIPIYLAATVLATGVSAVLAAPAQAVPAVMHFESAPIPSNSSSPKTVVAYCPANSFVLGGGAHIDGAEGEVALVEARPVVDLSLAPPFKRSFRVTASERTGGTAKTWSLKASVYCTSDTVTVIKEGQSNLDSAPIKSVPTPACPGGMKVVGAGGYVSIEGNPGFSSLETTPVRIQRFAPDDSLNFSSARATESGGILDDQYPGNWRVHAVAMCAYSYAFPGLELRPNTVSSWLLPWKPPAKATIACSPGKRLLGAGADLQDDGAASFLQWAIRTNLTNTKVSTEAVAENGSSPLVTLKAYAICASG